MKPLDTDKLEHAIGQIASEQTRDVLRILVGKLNQVLLVIEEHGERIDDLETAVDTLAPMPSDKEDEDSE